MEQPIVEALVIGLDRIPRNGQPSEVLLRLWTEAEQAMAASARIETAPSPAIRRERARVLYTYD
ncbi:MAG: hypothetical protein RML36_01830 [Anaerolineae bacterium]|nr:hypothetical protein [Anaerolineae bacterium]MDW8098207.1 hypothetical protein [Anaerolineae bacterium]